MLKNWSVSVYSGIATFDSHSSIYDDLCDKDKLLALMELFQKFPNVESLK